MTGPLVVGILAAFVATTVAAGVRRMPTRALCPACGAETESVQPHPALRRAAPELRVRWCARCSWEGLGREGPELTPGRPVAHDSGFRWSARRLPEDQGFRFAPRPVEERGAPAPPPAHPSGFRFSGEPDPGSGSEGPGTGPFFRWAPSRTLRDFRWGGPRLRGDPFRWKDAG